MTAILDVCPNCPEILDFFDASEDQHLIRVRQYTLLVYENP